MLTALVVAGKQSHIQEQKLGGFYSAIRLAPGAEPFPVIARLSPARLRAHLEEVRMGQYNRLTRAFCEMSRAVVGGTLNLRSCTRGQLAGFPGIGLKTASYFLLYTRPGARIACIDTHILAWLAERHPEVPGSTPQNPAVYSHWENVFLHACDLAEKAPAEMDFEIWLARKTARGARRSAGE